MMRLMSAFLALVIMSPAVIATEEPQPGGEAALIELIESERRAKEAYFRDNPWSPVRAVSRFDFDPERPAPATLGASSECEVHLDADGMAPRQLIIEVLASQGDGEAHRFRLTNIGDDDVVRAAGELLGSAGSDAAQRIVPAETLVTIGPYAVRPYVQANAGILILFDSRLTSTGRFEPPRYFPVEPDLSFRATLVPATGGETVELETSLGRTKSYRRVGHFELTVDGIAVRLYAYQPTFVQTAEGMLSVLFSDLTSGKESYGSGRYLDIEADDDGAYRLDFNRAYNPFCSYTEVYNCPIPPRENRLKVALRAGEKSYPH